jgi:hypothetical protein
VPRVARTGRIILTARPRRMHRARMGTPRPTCHGNRSPVRTRVYTSTSGLTQQNQKESHTMCQARHTEPDMTRTRHMSDRTDSPRQTSRLRLYSRCRRYRYHTERSARMPSIALRFRTLHSTPYQVQTLTHQKSRRRQRIHSCSKVPSLDLHSDSPAPTPLTRARSCTILSEACFVARTR